MNNSFIAGTSSTLFNQGFLTLNNSNADGFITDAIQAILGAIGSEQNDIALYPNSFAQWEEGTNPISDFTTITLVDGGEVSSIPRVNGVV